jgi:signal peptidase I
MEFYWKGGVQMSLADIKSTSHNARKIARPVYEWVSTLIIALLVMAALFTFLFRVVRVDGDSMETTLQNNDQLLVLTAVSDYKRGDIVVVDRYTIEPLVKRVVAIGGDTIRIDDAGRVYLNNSLLNEPYASMYTSPKGNTEPIVIPEGYVFLMGDNRMVSLDSRSPEIGLVLEKDLIGKAIFRVSPFSGIYGNMEQSIN